MRETRKAAVNFIDTILQQDASIGIVTFSDYAYKRTDFSKNGTYLKNVVEEISTENMTNTESGLIIAEQMLDASTAKKKFIVLMSDGLPNRGMDSEDLIDYAEELKEKGILIYTLGFFQSVDYWDLSSAQYLMEKIASDGCHFEVEDADNLVFFFEDIADQIRGTNYIYIRIACPVDVRVEYNGEVLSSTGNTRTSFGTVTFEEGESSYYRYNDDRTKIVRLKEGADYKIQILGNGEGTMDCTVSFVDENGKYTDQRMIEDVPVTSNTVIESNVQRDKRTILQVDNDGDGKFDKNYDLGGPEVPQEEKKGLPWWAWVLIGVGGAALIGGVILVIVLTGKKKRSTGGSVPYDSRDIAADPVFVPRTERAGTESAARFCPRCGRPNDGMSRFCVGCGTELGAETAPIQIPAPEKTPAMRQEPPKTYAAREPVAEEKTNETTPASPWKPAARGESFADLPPKPAMEETAKQEAPAEKPAGVLRSSMRTKPATMTLFKSESAARPEPNAEKPAGFCSGCGKPITEGTKFCMSCGRPIDAAAEKPEPVKNEAPVPEPEVPIEPPVIEPEPPIVPVEPPVTEPEPPIVSVEPPVSARPSGRAKFCLRCGEPIDEGAKFCLHCGEPIEGDVPMPKPPAETTVPVTPPSAGRAKFCLHCGAPVEADAKFCLHCGERL